MEEGEGSSRREEPPAAAPAPRFTVKTELSDTTASDLALRLVRHRQRAVEFLGAMADSKEAAEQAAGPARHHLTSALIIACAALQRARITADIASKSDELVDEASGADDAAAAAPEPSSRESPALQTLDGVRAIYDTYRAMYRCLDDLNEHDGVLFDPLQAELEVALTAFKHVFDSAHGPMRCSACGETDPACLEEDMDNSGTFYCVRCWQAYDESAVQRAREGLTEYSVEELLALRDAPLARRPAPPELQKVLLAFTPRPQNQNPRKRQNQNQNQNQNQKKKNRRNKKAAHVPAASNPPVQTAAPAAAAAAAAVTSLEGEASSSSSSSSSSSAAAEGARAAMPPPPPLPATSKLKGAGEGSTHLGGNEAAVVVNTAAVIEPESTPPAAADDACASASPPHPAHAAA